MGNNRYTAEFKAEAIKQITERGHGVVEVSKRLGISDKSLYLWLKQSRGKSNPAVQEDAVALKLEVTRLKAELKRATEERDILKKAAGVLCQTVRVKYAFIDAHRQLFRLISMCRVLKVHRSGYYAWKQNPLSRRAVEDAHLLVEIKRSFDDSDRIYGSPRVHCDLREAGVVCGLNRVARIMRCAQLKSVRGYRKPRFKAGKPAIVAPNRLQQQFSVAQADTTWVTDITYVRTYEGWLYVAVVIDLYSRTVVGWSMKPNMMTDIVLDALMMAKWRRRPKQPVIIHSDQGSQFGSDDFARWCKDNQLVPSMSRRGNCYDNAVAESFFSSLKKERIQRKIYRTRDEAKSDIFDYIESFYNCKRRHSHIGQVSPMTFEKLHRGS
ncbi:IS3 family transposase [Glaciimonas sp. GS1]|uniref:IS3 family transposase n=1 Tax=Glaciimonas soli TaxID=2590999 RepID=A0A843YT97_9BURK|nr:IS3 family transposase [Glaciimonas soli]MQR02795.1 IS3 family transposase [Glaciimonas soli]